MQTTFQTLYRQMVFIRCWQIEKYRRFQIIRKTTFLHFKVADYNHIHESADISYMIFNVITELESKINKVKHEWRFITESINKSEYKLKRAVYKLHIHSKRHTIWKFAVQKV